MSKREKKKNSESSKALEQISKAKNNKGEKRTNQIEDDDFQEEELENTQRLKDVKKQEKQGKKRKNKEEKKPSKPIPSIFLNQKQTSSPPTKKVKSGKSENEDEYIQKILAGLGEEEEEEEEIIAPSPPKKKETPEKKNPTPEKKIEKKIESKQTEKKIKAPEKVEKKELPKEELEDLEGLDLMEFDDEIIIQKQKKVVPPKKKEMVEEEGVISAEKFEMKSKEKEDLSESFEMFLLDVHEEKFKEGTLYLFGKLNNGNSCCVIVQNLERNIYLLPKIDNEDQIEEEIDKIALNHGIKNHKHKIVERNYAFDKKGVPHGKSKFVKLVYSAKYPSIELKSDKIFSHIFGTNATCLELFLVKRKIKGPCWIKIKSSTKGQEISYCTSEVICKDPKDIEVLENQKPCPPLKIMSIRTRIINNDQNNEIIMISACCNSKVNVDTNPEPEKNLTKFTLVRRVDQFGSIPQSKDYTKQSIEIFENESSLLNKFISYLGSFDPDVLIGHNFLQFDLDVLLHRMKEKSIKNWSILGRLKRSSFPKLQTGAGGISQTSYAEQVVLTGRLICDTYISAVDYLRESNNSLKHLAKSQLSHLLKDKNDLMIIDSDPASLQPYFEQSKGIISLANNNFNYAYYQMMLMFQLTLLTLSKELATSAGSLWSKALVGNRSDRIDLLLYHEFHQKKYIVPDREKKEKETTKTKKKAEYAGGLVIAPQKGLYDKYILLLDFNSLYPSIILEKNLCFTTVVRDEEKENILETKIKTDTESVLPKVIKFLLERRSNVKNQMNREKDPAKKWQLDIRQKALKLTANSTYGCLGFTQSRFYCKAIAELITAFGRDNLTRTKTDIETKLGYQIIYGDTDSVMVLTQFTDFSKAMKVGNEIIQFINKNHKNLQLGIDALFRKMLLLEKKKYVALVHTLNSDSEKGYSEKIEKKGIDEVRRDWCNLSKDVSRFCIDQILSDLPSEQVVQSIHQHLKEVSEKVRKGEMDIEKFILTKELSKNPKDYPDIKQLPHVMVAKRMLENGESVVVKQRIQYVICDLKDKSLAERAFSIDEFNSNDDLKLDLEWYLSAQVHPPIIRLCKHIQGTDSALLAEYLGLDKNLFHSKTSDEKEVNEWYENDQEKYKNCQLSPLKCNHCNKEVILNFQQRMLEINKQLKEIDLDEIEYLICNSCNKSLFKEILKSWIYDNVRTIQKKYYKQTMITSNGNTQTLSINPGNAYYSGNILPYNLEFSQWDLYLHFSFIKSIFDYEKNFKQLERLEFYKRIKNEYLKNSKEIQLMDECKNMIDSIINTLGYHYVDLGSLFQLLK